MYTEVPSSQGPNDFSSLSWFQSKSHSVEITILFTTFPQDIDIWYNLSEYWALSHYWHEPQDHKGSRYPAAHVLDSFVP